MNEKIKALLAFCARHNIECVILTVGTDAIIMSHNNTPNEDDIILSAASSIAERDAARLN